MLSSISSWHVAAVVAGLLIFWQHKRKQKKAAAPGKADATKGVPKLAMGGVGGGAEGSKPGQAVMDTAMRLQSTGGADSYQHSKTGWPFVPSCVVACTHLV